MKAIKLDYIKVREALQLLSLLSYELASTVSKLNTSELKTALDLLGGIENTLKGEQ